MPGKSKKGGGLMSSPVYKKTPFKMKGFSGFGNSPLLAKDEKPGTETSLGKLREADADIRSKIKNIDMSKLTPEQRKMLESYMKSGR